MENNKTPSIRFKGFTDPWEQRKLGDVVQITMGQSPDGSTYSDEPSDYILVQGNADLQNGWVCPRVWTTQITKKADAGDLIMSVRAPAGAMGKTAYNAVIGRGVAAIKGNEFIYQLLIKIDKEGYWKKDSTGSTFESLNSSSIKNAEIKLPTLEEQNKIGEYFLNLDNLITLHQRELEKQNKKIYARKDVCLGGKEKMKKITLYHGTPDKIVVPTFGKGEGKHDYGRGFYLTESIDLAKEWAVCRPNETNGYVHQYELDTEGLEILDFQEKGVLAWLAELMKHRDAADSKRYRMLAKKFIAKYGVDTDKYDVIKGWRANASYFYIAKEFVRDNIDMDILEELLSLGGLGIQYCIKSELAYSKLHEVANSLQTVEYTEFNEKYNQRDITARQKMRELVDSDANHVTKVFSTLFEE